MWNHLSCCYPLGWDIGGKHWADRRHGLASCCIRNGLRRPRMFVRARRLRRNRCFPDTMDWLAGFTIQNIQISVFAGFRQRSHALTSHLHVKEHRLVAGIIIPDVVMSLLEVPLQLARVESEGK